MNVSSFFGARRLARRALLGAALLALVACSSRPFSLNEKAYADISEWEINRLTGTWKRKGDELPTMQFSDSAPLGEKTTYGRYEEAQYTRTWWLSTPDHGRRELKIRWTKKPRFGRAATAEGTYRFTLTDDDGLPAGVFGGADEGGVLQGEDGLGRVEIGFNGHDYVVRDVSPRYLPRGKAALMYEVTEGEVEVAKMYIGKDVEWGMSEVQLFLKPGFVGRRTDVLELAAYALFFHETRVGSMR